MSMLLRVSNELGGVVNSGASGAFVFTLSAIRGLNTGMFRYALSLATVILCTSSYGQDVDAGGADKSVKSGGLNLQLTPTVPENIRIQSDHGAEYNAETGLVRYTRGVQIFTDNGIQLFADNALMDSGKKMIYLRGDVSIYQNSVLHRGEQASYNYGTKELDTQGLRSSLDPILLDSDSFAVKTVNGKRVFIGKNAGITTHDRAKPDFWLRADEINVYPEDKVVFHDLKLYAGETPIFWLPYLAQSVDSQLGYHFIPGSRSNWGAFLLNSYGVMLGGEANEVTGDRDDQWLLSEWKFDLRSRRGVGFGVDFSDTRLKENENLTGLSFYYTNDQNPEISRNGISRLEVSNDRYKVGLRQRWEWESDSFSRVRFDANLAFLSDRYYMEDFSPREYSTNNQPENIVGVQKLGADYQLGAFTRFQLNDYYLSDTRFPEVYFDQVKRPILGSNLLHEGVLSMGVYHEELGDFDAARFRAGIVSSKTSARRRSELERLLGGNDFTRLHTYQELSYPVILADGLSVTPRAGAGYSQYWNEGDTDTSHGSPHVYFGLDSAMKFTKNYGHVQDSRLGLNELLHVVQPYANLSVLSTNELEIGDSKIDRLTATERPRAFDVARYTAIDDYRNWSIVRLGVRNQLLTKRNGLSHSWLTLDTYVDTFLNDPEFERDMSNLYNDLSWNPVPWGRLRLNTQFPITSAGFTEVSTGMEVMPYDDLELTFGHTYLSGHPLIENSNLVHLRANFRLSHRWGLGASQQWQFDDNTLERQELSVNRNFESWSLGLGLYQRDNRLKKEYGALLNISLNALPAASLPLSLSAE